LHQSYHVGVRTRLRICLNIRQEHWFHEVQLSFGRNAESATQGAQLRNKDTGPRYANSIVWAD
jgi:hypothetical protein